MLHIRSMSKCAVKLLDCHISMILNELTSITSLSDFNLCMSSLMTTLLHSTYRPLLSEYISLISDATACTFPIDSTTDQRVSREFNSSVINTSFINAGLLHVREASRFWLQRLKVWALTAASLSVS